MPKNRYLAKPARNSAKSMSSIITTNKNNTATAPTYTITSSIAMNSAPASTISPAALKKARISHSTLCTGFFAKIVKAPESSTIVANR